MRYLLFLFLFCLNFKAIALEQKLKETPEPAVQVTSVIEPFNAVQRESLHFQIPPLTQWRFSYFNETVFNSKIVVLEAGDKNNPPLLLVHGLGELAMQDWFSVIPTLEESYYVIAIDLPGFGNSYMPQGRYSPTNYANVLVQVIDSYIAKPVTVIGHSMGGAVSLSLTGSYPEHIKKLILVDAAGVLQKVAFLKPISNIPEPNMWLPRFLRTKLAQLNDFTTGLIELGAIDSYFSDVLQRSNGAWNALMGKRPNINAALSLVEEDFSQIVDNVKTQTHIIWGESDAIAPLRTAKVLHNQLVNSEFMIIENTGHVPMATATTKFLSLLEHALTQPFIKTHKVVPPQTKLRELLECDDQHSKTFTGNYKHIVISGCNNVLLKDITTHSIVITNSLVRLENVNINSDDLALKMKKSVVEVTNMRITAKKGINLDGGRFDGAGVVVIASSYAMNIDAKSNVIFSLSKITSPHYQGNVHQAFELTNKNVDDYLNQH